jgi:hypothetical protein
MDTLMQDRHGDCADVPTDDDGDGRLPPRPRRRLLTPPSVAVLALATCAIGFYVGVRVEKGHTGSGSASLASAISAAGRASAGTGGAGSAGTGSAGTGSAATGSAGAGSDRAGRSGFAGFAARFGGAGGPGGPGGGSAGTVASVDGRSLVLKEASGDTVAVKLTSATKVTKSKSVGHGQIRPGDTIVVSGVTGDKGTISAASVSDSGASASATSSSSGGSTSAGSGGSTSAGSGGSTSAGSGGSGSAVGSLFSGG